MKPSRAGIAALFTLCAIRHREPSRSPPSPLPHARSSTHRETTPSATPPPRRAAYLSDRVLVATSDPQALARRHHSAVLRPAGPSGFASLALPKGRSMEHFLAELRTDPATDTAMRCGATYGAGEDTPVAPAHVNALQWHLDAARVPPIDGESLREITVAVLDTGVAYEAIDDASGRTVTAPSLLPVTFRSPWDFVNGDADPIDDHQHGTHIASLIASQGGVSGVAPGVGLMPIKVLDADNTGDEQALLDGLTWALQNGADVINLSLSFGEGYVPSESLQYLLADASAVGVVVVAAAGNSGSAELSWPAAARTVVAVGASALNAGGEIVPTDYSNTAPGMTLLAPGGDLDHDYTGDGYGDGILAETISKNDPSSTGFWFYEGTSQAAAQVSGAVAHLLADGVAPEEIPTLLQATATPVGEGGWASGWGAGALNLAGAREPLVDAAAIGDTHAAILPYLLRDETDSRIPVARVRVVDDADSPLAHAQVFARIRAQDDVQSTVSCELDEEGSCLLVGPSETAVHAEDAKQAWLFTLDAVVVDGVSSRPGAMFYTSDGLELLAAGLSADEELADATLAFSWTDERVEGLGKVGAALSFVDLQTGPVASPSGLLLTAALSDTLFHAEPVDIDLDGSGLATDALGVSSATHLTGGSGLATDALGLVGSSHSVVAMEGSGLSTDALGLTAASLVLPSETAGLGLGLQGVPAFLGDLDPSVAGTWTATLLGEENERLGGYSAVSAMAASEGVGLGAAED